MRLTKHHGLGNDFLVLLDLDGAHAGLGPADARALCDRHRGIGADGLIRAHRPAAAGNGVAAVMDLWNADGSRAEMSGNGIRCLAQAMVDAHAAPSPQFVILTDAGLRRVSVRPAEQPNAAWVSAEMGAAAIEDATPADACNVDHAGMRVSMGNPHLVLLGPDPRTVAVDTVGRDLDAATPGGTNVEFVALGPGPDEITMRVWERGVGETEACGTGACAAAAAVHRWQRVGRKVTVHQPGGAAEVDLSGPEIVLSGPVHFVATVDWPHEEVGGP